MSQSRYDAYKDSGVAWLGQVPAHWEVVALKRTLDIQNGHDYKHIESENGYPVIGSGGIFAFASDYLFDGESILLGRKGTIDKPLHFRGKFWTVDTMFWSKIATGVYGRFIYYVATEIPFAMYSTNTALPSMAKSVLEQHLIPLPPLAEQQAIAALLDRECARIDALVAAQQRMIALSKEKRQALISHAVTRGLDPAAPCKDSGVAWLGQVPAHWEVKRLNILGQFLKGSGGTKEDITLEGLPCIRYGELYGKYDKFIEKIFNFISPENENAYTRIYFQDVIFAASGEKINEIGKSAVYLSFDLAVCGGDTVIFRPFENIFFGRFLGYTCDSVYSQQQKSSMYRGTTIKHIYPDELKNIIIPLPPLAEQQAIAAFLDRECARIDTLIERAEQAIVLLRERRSALIAAAVTGQIRVDGVE
jgi:type I restriction enzyme, S subunit